MKEHTYNDTNNNNNDTINIKDTTIHKTKSETECNNNLPEIKRYETQKRKLTQKLKKTFPKYLKSTSTKPTSHYLNTFPLYKSILLNAQSKTSH
jgi:hypothetical protein